MISKQMKLFDAMRSGKCFRYAGNIWRAGGDYIFLWSDNLKKWELSPIKVSSNSYVNIVPDPALKPRPCTFMEAWEHMKKYPKRKVCLFRDMECMYHSSVVIEGDRCLFRIYEDKDIIDSDEWKLIPQEEGE